MKYVWRLLALGALLGLFAAPASAQYVYLDTNGDGVHSSADLLQPNGTPTTVDAYINTNHNKDGSLATCDTGDGDLGFWNSYAVNLKAAGGSVTFSNFVNQQAGFNLTCVGVGVDFLTAGDEMTSCRATATSTAGGLQKMFTVTVTGQAGTPSLQVIPLGTLSPNFTSFGTPCSAHDFDNTYKLGSDFMDSDGAGPAPGGNATPVLTAPLTVNAGEGQPVTVTATATDTDASDVLTITATGAPSSLTLNTTPGTGTVTATLTGTLGLNDQGDHNIVWSVSDGTNPPQTATTVLTVANLDQPPVVTAPATASAVVGTAFTLEVTASDADADVITSLAAEPLPVGAMFTTNSGHTSGTLTWTPVTGQEGTADITFTAMANGAFGMATTHVTVAGGGSDVAPTVTAPAAQTGSEGTLLTFTVSANDGNGDAIASLMGSPLPSGATFTANGTNTEGTFSWTPSSSQAGTYNITWTAANSLSGTASTAITITDVDHPPVLDAINNVTVAENGTATVNLHATDQDNDLVTLTATLPAFATLNFPTSGTGDVATTITLAPGGGTEGTYTGTVTATSGLQTSIQTFTITVTGVGGDQAPVVTAPATVSGTEGTEVSFTVTASDANGDAITSLTAANLPTGASFTANGSNTSGTFTWTPSVGTTGTFDVTFTASNALSGSAMTHITIEGAGADVAPVVTVTPNVSGTVGAELTFTVTAIDANGDAITSLTAAPLPTGATFNTNTSNTSGTFTWTPTAAQTGTFDVTFTASNALSGSAAAHITIEAAGVDAAPVVTAPPTAGGTEGTLITFTVTAADANGDAIASLMAAPLPSGATFNTNASYTSGTFSWTPSAGTAGTYDVTFTAANALSGSAMTHITVEAAGADQAPVVTAPATQNGTEGVQLSFVVTAFDADGDAITSLTAAPIPSGATFNTNGSNTSGTFTWTPSSSQAGTYDVTFTASNALSGSATTHITIGEGGTGEDHPPVVCAPRCITTRVGRIINFRVTASDKDGDAITSLIASTLPTGATFTTNSANTEGTFRWTPTAGQEGTYDITFTAQNALSGHATTHIKVREADQSVVIDQIDDITVAEGGSVTVPVHASDADNDNIVLTACLPPFAKLNQPRQGFGSVTTSLTVSPTSGDAGTYNVFVRARGKSGDCEIERFVITVTPAGTGGGNTVVVFTSGSNNVLHLGQGWCVSVEPTSGSFAAADVNLSSLMLSYQGQNVTATASNVRVDADENHNSTMEVEVCFDADQLTELFGALGNGSNNVMLTVSGTLTGGGTFTGNLTQNVVVSGGLAKGHGKMNVTAKPNPLNPKTDLLFRTSRAGAVRVDLFDASGRLVKSLVAQNLAAGQHTVPWDGTNEHGGHVASGSYFFRIQAPDGQQVQRVTVVK